MTGNKIRDAALGEPRIRAGEIIGWRIWRLCNGLLQSVIVPYTWYPGEFERSTSKHGGYFNYNPGYHAFRHKEQAERDTPMHAFKSPVVIGSVAMWGEVIEHQYGWRSEYAAVRSLIKITGDIRFRSTHWLLIELREKYGCTGVTELMSDESAGTDGDKSGKAHFWAHRLNEYATNMAVEIDQRCPKEKSCLVRNDSSVRRPHWAANTSIRGTTGTG